MRCICIYRCSVCIYAQIRCIYMCTVTNDSHPCSIHTDAVYTYIQMQCCIYAQIRCIYMCTVTMTPIKVVYIQMRCTRVHRCSVRIYAQIRCIYMCTVTMTPIKVVYMQMRCICVHRLCTYMCSDSVYIHVYRDIDSTVHVEHILPLHGVNALGSCIDESCCGIYTRMCVHHILILVYE